MAACATDLARKKILPTIFNLWRRKLLPRDLVLFGYAREPLDDERFRRTVFNCIYNPAQPQSERKEFMQRVHYQGGQFGDPVAIGQLLSRLRDEERTRLISRKASYGPLRQLSDDPEAEPAQQAPAPNAPAAFLTPRPAPLHPHLPLARCACTTWRCRPSSTRRSAPRCAPSPPPPK